MRIHPIEHGAVRRLPAKGREVSRLWLLQRLCIKKEVPPDVKRCMDLGRITCRAVLKASRPVGG